MAALLQAKGIYSLFKTDAGLFPVAMIYPFVFASQLHLCKLDRAML
jgi:hypothetical protein